MFVKDLYSISPQPTSDLRFEGGDFHVHEGVYYTALEPAYQDWIPAKVLRRMGKAVRMGVGAALPLFKRNAPTDGIIIGSSSGGLEDCIYFLNQIIEYNEGLLTPTHFMQSTPNALAGQLSVLVGNTGYNMTHVGGSLAFENAVQDASLFLDGEKVASSLLLGAVDEISAYNYNIDVLAGRYKDVPTANTDLLPAQTDGSVCGEAATMFIVSNSREDSLGEILDVTQITTTRWEAVIDLTKSFLAKNDIVLNASDLLILGSNGDRRTDGLYDRFAQVFSGLPAISYKNACGQFRTASAFATYLGIQILSGRFSNTQLCFGPLPSKVNRILIYNHFDGERHGLILLRR